MEDNNSLSNPIAGCSYSSTSYGSEINRKRHCFQNDDDSDDNEQPCTKVLVTDKPLGLDSICDEILLEIFKNLDGNALSAIGRTCVRFYFLINDNRLWKNVDFTSEQLSSVMLIRRSKSLNAQTESLRIRGMAELYPLPLWKTVTICEYFLKNITEKCEYLQELELHHNYIDCENISITNFPKNLKRLVFNSCHVRLPATRSVFFTKVDTHFSVLEELSLEYCSWFETHDLVLFSKIPTLKKLSLRGCENFRDCVPYGSISARFGFKKLEHLDIRDTPIQDSDIQCFTLAKSLKELLLECPVKYRGPSKDQNSEQKVRRPTFQEAQHPEDRPLEDNDDPNDEPSDEDFVRYVSPILRCRCGKCRESSNRSRSSCGAGCSGGSNSGSSSASGSSSRSPGNSSSNNSIVIDRISTGINEWVIIPTPNNNNCSRQDDNNLIHIVVNDYSYINIQPSVRHNNRLNSSFQVNISARSPSQNLHPLRNIDRAMSRSLWFERRYAPPFQPPTIHPISDRGILGFGSPRFAAEPGLIWIRAEHRSPDHNLERLVVRHYVKITNTSLEHLSRCSPNLVYLDLTGTSVTKSGVNKFRRTNPTCVVVAGHLSESDADDSQDGDDNNGDDDDDDDVSR